MTAAIKKIEIYEFDLGKFRSPKRRITLEELNYAFGQLASGQDYVFDMYADLDSEPAEDRARESVPLELVDQN